MAMKAERIDIWAGEIRDQVGGLAAGIAPIVAAGASFSFVTGHRRPERPGTGVVFVGGIHGSKQEEAAKAAGFSLSPDVNGLRVETADKPGLLREVTSKLAAVGINLRAVSSTVVAGQCAMILAFDDAAARDEAVRVLTR